MSGRIVKAIPLFASLDMDETAAFYAEKLGFKVREQYGKDYLIVSRDDVILNFWPCSEKHIAENTSAYFNVSNVDDLYAELKPLGARMSEPKSFDYGMREFHVWDCHGNLLRFGEPV
ncbi:MAG: VOC family protein [Pseudomonadota bacterium]